MDLNDLKQQHFDSLNSPSGFFNISASACSNSSFNGGEIFPVGQQLVSANSFDLNVAASLSDDSGVPLTNSSISSADSCRVELCKLELELAGSDCEVSQFDSLEDFSDCGMSGEQFNTLKKGPLAPIDPPPEFQDSPQTTMLRSGLLQNYAVNLSEHVIVTALNKWLPFSKVDGEDGEKDFFLSSLSFDLDKKRNFFLKNDININIDTSNHIYGSDSLLNRCYSLYDNTQSNLSSSCEKKLEIVATNAQQEFNMFNKSYSQNSKPTPALTKPKAHKFTLSKNQDDHHVTEIYDYNFYYALKKCQKNNYYHQSHKKTHSSILYSPIHHHLHTGGNIPSLNRPNSRNSLNSRLSSSHNSLTVPNANKADDSIFITQAMSHDALLSQEICDFYNVPIGADIYSFPIDMINPPLLSSLSLQKTKDYGKYDSGKMPMQKDRFKNTRNKKRRRCNNAINEATGIDKIRTSSKVSYKRHSVPENTLTPLHMTLDEVKKFYHSLYSARSGSNETLPQINNNNNSIRKKDVSHIKLSINNEQTNSIDNSGSVAFANTLSTGNMKNTTKPINSKYLSAEKTKRDRSCINKNENVRNFVNITSANKYLTPTGNNHSQEKKSQFFINLNLKQKFCNIFRFRKSTGNRKTNSSMLDPPDYIANRANNRSNLAAVREDINKFSSRALPPLPNKNSMQKSDPKNSTCNVKDEKKSEFNSTIHFASNIEKVKDCGWYWGPISSEAAEKILSNEPDGSFIVRDSSDDHYIFSLSFKLNNCVRHVRIEQDQGTFSFGSYAKFKSQTITEFIEKAVEHSRSGRYLFFLHRRPEHGPMRVQLTNPVSRFKHIQSLQHMCRFVILKAVVRKDLIPNLPLPRRLLDYLSYKHCYSEQVECDSSSQSQSSGDDA